MSYCRGDRPKRDYRKPRTQVLECHQQYWDGNRFRRSSPGCGWINSNCAKITRAQQEALWKGLTSDQKKQYNSSKIQYLKDIMKGEGDEVVCQAGACDRVFKGVRLPVKIEGSTKAEITEASRRLAVKPDNNA